MNKETPWSQTMSRLRRDRKRLRDYLEADTGPTPTTLLFSEAYQCLILHRLSHYLFNRDRRLLARLLWHLNLFITGADLSPITDLGGGALIPHPALVTIIGKLGENCTLWGQVGIGGGMSERQDIGAGPGLPVIGDEVEVYWGTLIMGPVRIGRGARLGPGCIIINDVAEGAVLEPSPPRFKTAMNDRQEKHEKR